MFHAKHIAADGALQLFAHTAIGSVGTDKTVAEELSARLQFYQNTAVGMPLERCEGIVHEGTAGLQIVLQERFVEGLAVDHPYLVGRLNLAHNLGAYQQPYFPHGTIVVLEVGHQLGKQRIGLVRQSATANLLTGKLGSVH